MYKVKIVVEDESGSVVMTEEIPATKNRLIEHGCATVNPLRIASVVIVAMFALSAK